MSDRELMQQALELLDDINQCSLPPTGIPLPAEIDHVMEALRARLAQPEPEPVAWMYDWYDETEDIDGVPIGGIVHDWISKDYDEAHSPTMGCHNIRPLYTAPPQHEWQGLTDEDMKEIVFVERSWADAVRKVEAKLKEKNGGH